MATRYFVYYRDYVTGRYVLSQSHYNVGFFDVKDAQKLMRRIARKRPLVPFRLQSNDGKWTSLPFATTKRKT